MNHRKHGTGSQDFADRILNALIGLGLVHFVVSPGSRNAPLLYGLAQEERKARVRTYVRIDERDAGFTALGLAKAEGKPSAVVTTSGTAVANVFPAILEARHSGVPLLAITADRPPELVGTGANQTTKQQGIYGDKVMASFVVDAIDTEQDFGNVDSCMHKAYGRMMAAPRGPVHLNVHFREPLVPLLQRGPE